MTQGEKVGFNFIRSSLHTIDSDDRIIIHLTYTEIAATEAKKDEEWEP